jgi:hypothetical protein
MGLALLSALGAASGRVQFFPTHVHPKLKSGQAAIHRVVILPPLIEFNRLSLKGPEGMPDQSDRLAENLYAVLAKEFAARGVEIAPNPIAAATDEQKYAVANLQAKYDNVRVQLRKKPYRVEEGHLTLGDGVSAFGPAKGVDAIVLVRGAAVQATKGKKAAVVIGMGALSGFQGDVGLVDARTGDVLAWGRINERWHDVSTSAADRLTPCTREALRDVPLPVAAAKR